MKPVFYKALFVLLTTAFSCSVFSQTSFISFGSNWKYLDTDTRPGSWQTSGFDDSGWPSAPSMFGYNDGDVVTCVKSSALPISCTPGGENKYITTYFRKSITIANPAIFSDFTLNVYRDDGIVVYINRTERLANNMPAGRLHSTLATMLVMVGM